MVRKSVVIAITLMIIAIVVVGSISYIYLSKYRPSKIVKHITKPTKVKITPTCSISWPNVTVQYAKLFKIINTGKYYIIIKDASNHTFILVPNGCPIPKNVSGIVLKVPLSRVVYFSTTEVALLYRIAEALHNMTLLRSIIGVTWRGVWWIPHIQDMVNNGTIKYVGSSWNPNIEKIVSLNPQLVVMYTGIPTMVQVMYKLEKSGLKVFVDNEWLEHTYLARFEWIKAIAALYGPKALKASEEIFEKTVKTVEEIYNKCRNTRPVKYAWMVMYWGKFYIPGTESYVVKALSKMNGVYIFATSRLARVGSVTASREFIDSKIPNAQVIVISGFPPYTTSINIYIKTLPDMSTSPAVKMFRIFMLHPSYWQLGYAYTGQVLLQLASILHPYKFRGIYRTFFIPIYYNNINTTFGKVKIIWRGYYEIVKDYYNDSIMIIPWGLINQTKYYNPKVFTAIGRLEKDLKIVNAIVQTPVHRIAISRTCLKYVEDLGFSKSVIYIVNKSLNIENIVKLRPQVVVLDYRNSNISIVRKLLKFKIPVIVLDCSSKYSGFIISLLYNYPDLGYMLYMSK